MKKIDTYIGRTLLASIAMVALVLAVLVMLARFVNDLDYVSSGTFSWPELLTYILLKTPSDMLIVLPMITLLGALMALGALAKGRELIVLRTAGVSMLRLAGAVSIAGIILAVITTGVGEYIVPAGMQTADQLRHTARYGAGAQSLGDGVWLRQGNDVVRIGGILPNKQVTDITLYRLDDSGHLLAAIHAPHARLEAQGMLLEQPKITRISTDNTQTATPEQLRVDVELSPSVLTLATVEPDDQSSVKLWHYIRYLQANDVDAGDYQLALWRNIVRPFTVWLLVVFTLPFAFGALRGAGAGQRLFLGGLLGMLFYLLNQIVGASGTVYGLPPWLAASLPTLALGLVTLVWIRRLD